MWNLFKNNKSYQAIKVRYQVEKRKKKAERMGLPELISDLYHDNIKYYPSHIDSARGNIPIIVERAVRNKPKYGDEKVEITLNNKVYSFKYCKA
tara:strand:- start:250 stop:531 length:282 start_codon:yes stop_codon:yes gene_type:complete